MKASFRIPVAAILALAGLSLLSCYYGPTATVSFDPNCEDSAIVIPAQSVSPGSPVRRPEDPQRLNHLFRGWYREVEAQSPWDFESDVVEASLTLYAGWEELAPESNAFLSALEYDAGVLNPAFSQATFSYSLSLPSDQANVTISGVPAFSGATVSGPVALLDLLPGEPRQASIQVLSADGTATNEYLVTARRAPEGLPTGSINASRTEGVAPLSVHFSAGAMATEEDSASFLTDEYLWDFGDPGAGTWGTDGKPKNLATGGTSAHVFETPGTYTVSLSVRDPEGNVSGDQVTVTVLDPDVVYAGEATICVSDIDDFSGAPAGSRQVVSTDMGQIASLVSAGTRLLFRRGGSWTAGDVWRAWGQNDGPVTIGAYGAGLNPDSMGIYENAPLISLTSEAAYFFSLNTKKDWRLMDLRFDDPARRIGTSGVNAAYEYQDNLVLRMRITGFGWGMALSHWNRDPVVIIQNNAIVSCDIHDLGEYGIFAGSEQLAVMGNKIKDVRDEHVLRVWQAWHSVISHNQLSGASLDGIKGDHALKLHGPGTGLDNWLGEPVPGTRLLRRRTDYVVVSDNVFGSCGPWPVMIAPQNNVQNEEVSNVVFERNLISTQFGTPNPNMEVQVSLRVSANRAVIRNNIIDGTGAATWWTGITVTRHGVEPAPEHVTVYNNSIYRADNGSAGERIGMLVGPAVLGIELANNLVSMPGSSVPVELLQDNSGLAAASNNLLSADPFFSDPDNPSPLLRRFSLLSGSPGIDTGRAVPVYDDFSGNPRPIGLYDLGATEQ